MTTIYVPRLIESAEQAEALPDGSIVINDQGDRYHRGAGWGWHSAVDDRDLTEDLDSTFMPPTITALVPIEAEEELQRTYAMPASTFPGLSWPEQHDAWKRRLVTPWEEA